MIINRKKGHYYNDAAMESWNRSLKVEAIQGEKFLSRAEAKQMVIEYFEAYETVKVLFHHPYVIMYSIDKYNELHINMTSRRYKSVSNRQQISLLPPSIEDYVHETNPVRAIDAYVATLDLEKQGFQNS